jgi:hypothetical protein
MLIATSRSFLPKAWDAWSGLWAGDADLRPLGCFRIAWALCALAFTWLDRSRIAGFAPDAVHISTEGPLGLAARRHCLEQRVPFTTAYHTQFPDYVAQRTGLPASWFWSYIQWFHRPSAGIMVATESVRCTLRAHGLDRLREWMDPRRYNGAILLGLNGVVVKSHGGTDAEGFANAIDVGYELVRYDLLTKINQMLNRDGGTLVPAPAAQEAVS